VVTKYDLVRIWSLAITLSNYLLGIEEDQKDLAEQVSSRDNASDFCLKDILSKSRRGY